MKEVDFSAAKSKMMAFCAYQERCRQEVFQKLEKFELTKEQESALVAELELERYLDEARFTKSYAEGKFRVKKWGRIRIKMELKRRNIPEELIRESIAGIDGDKYFEALMELIEKKLRTLQRKDQDEQKQKILRFAYSGGFEPDLILDALKEVQKEFLEEKF
jgi:regulatory protein